MNSHFTENKNEPIAPSKQSFDTYLAVCSFANISALLNQTDIPSNDIIIITGPKLDNLRTLLVKRFKDVKKNTIFETEHLLKYCKLFKPGNSDTTINVMIIAKPAAILLLQDLKSWNCKRYQEIFTAKIQIESHEYQCLTNMLQTKGLFYNTCKRIIANTTELACKHNIAQAVNTTTPLGPQNQTTVQPTTNAMFTYNKRFDITSLVKEIDKDLHIPNNLTISAIFLQNRTESPHYLNLLCKRFRLREFKQSDSTDNHQKNDRKFKEKCTISKFRKLLDHSDVIFILIIDQAFRLTVYQKKSPLFEPPVAITQFKTDRDHLKQWLESTKGMDDKFSLHRALKVLIANANKYSEQLLQVVSEESPSLSQAPLPPSELMDTDTSIANSSQDPVPTQSERSTLSYSLFQLPKRPLEEEAANLGPEESSKKKKIDTSIDRERYETAMTLLFFTAKAEETVANSEGASNNQRHTA